MERAFHHDLYYTGDKAYRDDDVIKSSGYRIGPFEVESALTEHLAAHECAVVGAEELPKTISGKIKGNELRKAE